MPKAISTNHSALKELFTVRDYLRYAASQFQEHHLYFGHGTVSAWQEATALVMSVLEIPFEHLEKVYDARLVETEKQRILSILKQRIETQKPLPYLTKKAYLRGFEFYVDERVIVPRSPLAELIENQFTPWFGEGEAEYILDCCCGSACLAILCAQYFPHANIHATDLSKDALEIAKINVEKFHLSNQIELFEADVYPKKNIKYDIIVSNPPYVDGEDMKKLPKEYHYEPKMALYGGEDGLKVIRKILAQAKKFLTTNGILIVEVGNSANHIEEAFPKIPWTWIQFEHGDTDAFILKYEDILKYHAYFK